MSTERQMTNEQGERLGILMRDFKPKTVEIGYSPFDLPRGWVAFVLSNERGELILAGGIDPDGSAST